MAIASPLNDLQTDWARKLREASRVELRELFRNSPAPDIMSVRGEFEAELLDQGGAAAQRLTSAVFSMRGNWLGKAFHPISETRGVGYNTFIKNGEIIPKLPMDTTLQPSTFEDGDSMIIRYNERHSGLIRWLVGELREVAPSVLLGIGLYGPQWGPTGKSQRKIPFMLVGPTRDYQLEVEELSTGDMLISGRFTRKG